MNRKDTILVAVLVNVGVLLILFISSLKPHTQQEWQALKIEEAQEDVKKIARVETKLDSKNETMPKEFSQVIDEFLSESKSEIQIESKVEATPLETKPVIAKETKKSPQQHEETSIATPSIAVAHHPAIKTTQTSQKEKDKNLLSDDHYYTVKNGDNPWTIATKNHIKVEELLKLNGLDSTKAKKIKPGDRLRIK
ncbi:MAG: LysM peptidoglycan-binding domain-containing protein [Chlamydiae bacterium]|jgi:peptidoglycan endopeptidase LytF|nr:LysM peptidoglycan-binding domain-containing protein [Chlamydiota bacterium]